MTRFSFFIICVLSVFMFSCKKQVTCAAYHSYFLLNEEAQNDFFNPFGQDSLPKTSQIVNNKGGNGITTGVNPKTYKKHHYFVPMEDVLLVDDSVAFNDEAPIESDSEGISTSGTSFPSDTASTDPVQNEFEGSEPIEDTELIEEEEEIDFDDFDADEIIDEGDDE